MRCDHADDLPPAWALTTPPRRTSGARCQAGPETGGTDSTPTAAAHALLAGWLHPPTHAGVVHWVRGPPPGPRVTSRRPCGQPQRDPRRSSHTD